MRSSRADNNRKMDYAPLEQKTPPQGSFLVSSSKRHMYEDSADEILESSNMITEQMILSEDSSSMHLIESRGLPRVTSSPGPLRFESSAEASSFLNQENNMRLTKKPNEIPSSNVSSVKADDSSILEPKIAANWNNENHTIEAKENRPAPTTTKAAATNR